MARKSDDLQFTIGEEEIGNSLVHEEEKCSSELETSEVAAIPESDSSGEGSSPDESALEALREAYGDLTVKLYSPILLEHLLSSELLTEVEYEIAKSKESSYEKNTEVLSAMRRRTRKEIVQFCQLLFTCNQSNCGRILLAALTNHGVDVSSIAQPSPKPPVIWSSLKYYPEMRDLKKRFITLVREVEGSGRQLEDLKTICIELLNDITSIKHNVQEDINKLRKCSDGDCIAHLQPYWDPLDCDLLYQLIIRLQKPELMTDWERYKVELKEACKATLAKARRSLPQRRELPAHQISAGFQTDQPSHDVIIQKILDLRDFLKKMMGMEEADFEGFDNGTPLSTSAVGGDNRPTVQNNFVRLSDVPLYKDGTYIDVAGIAVRTGNLGYFPHPERNAPFREITLMDNSAQRVTVKLWNKAAQKFNGSNNPVLLLKNVKVKFSGVNGTEHLSTDSSTLVQINPEHEVTENLNKWYYADDSSTSTRGSASIGSTSPAKVKDETINLDIQDSSQQAGHSNEHSISLENSEAEKTYKIMLDAFKEGGDVEVRIGKCVTMGPPEAGKTQLKRALLGDFTIADESTPACTKATPAVEIMLAGENKWKHFEFEHLKTLSLQEDSVNVSPRDATNTAIIPTPDNSSNSVSIVAAVNDQPSTQNTSGNATSRSNSSESSLTIERQSSLESFQSLNEHVTKCLVESNCCDENLKSMKLIYMVDSGGQPSFLDFHPVTATFAASYLLVYNMEEGLDAKPKMTYRKSNNFPTKELPPSTKTNLEILHRSMLTVHHFQVRFDERHRKISELMKDKFRAAPSAPPLFIVGTRKVPSSTNSHRKKLKPLYQNIPSLKRATSCKFVESMSPNCEGTKELRDSVSNEDSLCSFRLPLSWLKLHLMSVVTESDPEEESSHKELQVQTYSDLCEMCLNENIVRSKDEFKAMIMVFHSLGVFSCPDLEFKETQNQIEDYLIFVNPNLLYGFVSKLLEIPFINLDKWRNRPSLKDLQLAGELTLTALEDLGIPDKIGRCDGIHRRLLSWLVRWGLAATMDAGEKLFVPSVLPLQPDLPLPFRTTPFDPFPLQFCFIYDSTKNYTFHYLPEGFFPHFVVTLMKEGYTLPENDPEPEDDGIVPRCRDAIFLIRQRQKFDGAKNTFNIQLVDEGTHISIHMCPAGLHTESTRREAGHVLAEIKRKIEHTNEKLYYRSHDEIALCCNCTCGSEQRFAECHLARIDVGNDDHIKMTCLHPKRSCQLAWENDVTDDLLRAVIQTFHQSSGQCADTPAAKIANTNKSIVNSAPEMDTSGPQSSSKHGQRTPDSPVEPAKRPGRRSSSRPCGDCDVAPTCTQMEQATFSTQQSNGEFKHLPGQSSEPAFSQDSSLGSRGKRSPNQDADRLTQKRTRFTNVSVDDVIQIMTREKLTRGVEKMLTKHRIQTLCDDVHLIDDECRNRILAMLNNGQKTDAADRLIDYFKNNHNGSSLVSFCDFLRSEAEGAGNAPNLLDFSKQIAEAMKKALQHHQ